MDVPRDQLGRRVRAGIEASPVTALLGPRQCGKTTLARSSVAPGTLTRSMASALADLSLERMWVVYPGSERYPLHDRIDCIGLSGLDEVREALE